MPVGFATWQAVRTGARGEPGIGVWWRYVASLPDGTVAQAEGAADVAALALWWAGCFPEWVMRRAAGRGVIRSSDTFAGQALRPAARLLALPGPGASPFPRAGAGAGRVDSPRRADFGVVNEVAGASEDRARWELPDQLAE